MVDKKHRYQAYLLRLWQETSAGQPVWRVSLEDPHTGGRQGFADLDRLFAFLREQTHRGRREETGADATEVDS